MSLAKIENPIASKLFDILMGIEVQDKKNEQGIGGHSMVSNDLNLLHKIIKKSSQIIHLRP